MPLNLTLASRNLFHDKLRFIATMVGVVFSVVLVLVQMGLYEGFGRMVTTMIDHAEGDLWVMRDGTKCFEDPSLLNLSIGKTIRETEGVEQATPLLIGFSDWRLPSGEMTPVFILGSELKEHSLDPWNIIEGSVDALKQPKAVAVDVSYTERLGLKGLGTKADIRGQQIDVAALTSGIRSFTTTPYIFTEIARARSYIGAPKNAISYFLVNLKPGADVETVRKSLTSNIKNVEVLTRAEFNARSREFWLFGTGAGAALFAGAILGLIVGTVIVAQTLYSSTKDHLDEFATLRAMGSSNRYIYSVILYQAMLNAIIGFALASLVGFAVVWFTSSGALPVVITPWIIGAIFALTVAMCVLSGLTAIVRVVRIDPVMVFTR
ncbi:MAG TPA: ABC transporter permease [Pseudolabrys sp.]|nr:ABC transporter permease [Pseudolabrys sp.]